MSFAVAKSKIIVYRSIRATNFCALTTVVPEHANDPVGVASAFNAIDWVRFPRLVKLKT